MPSEHPPPQRQKHRPADGTAPWASCRAAPQAPHVASGALTVFAQEALRATWEKLPQSMLGLRPVHLWLRPEPVIFTLSSASSSTFSGSGLRAPRSAGGSIAWRTPSAGTRGGRLLTQALVVFQTAMRVPSAHVPRHDEESLRRLNDFTQRHDVGMVQ